MKPRSGLEWIDDSKLQVHSTAIDIDLFESSAFSRLMYIYIEAVLACCIKVFQQ